MVTKIINQRFIGVCATCKDLIEEITYEDHMVIMLKPEWSGGPCIPINDYDPKGPYTKEWCRCNRDS